MSWLVDWLQLACTGSRAASVASSPRFTTLRRAGVSFSLDRDEGLRHRSPSPVSLASGTLLQRVTSRRYLAQDSLPQVFGFWLIS